ncbi:MAG TPA: glycosyltransferase family 2 protein [Syntrophales bacterium]|nr:glycosyltransferase family 2 protein [Syntrophales bacterium]
MKLSIVTTMYHSASYVEEFYSRVKSAAGRITDDYEIIFVNDGSPDDSLDIAVSLYEKDPKVKVIDLSRNFGHHRAIMTGLMHAEGEKIFLINCDLEEAPENLELFHGKLAENPDSDVAYGMLKARKGGGLNRVFGQLFYMTLNFISDLDLDAKMAFSRVMTRRYVKSLLKYREKELFLPGLWHLTGYKQLPVDISSRHKGKTTYTVRRKLALLINAVTSFSEKPLIYIFYAGLALSFVSGVFSLFIIINKIFFNAPILGWASLIVSMWFIGGILILFMGIIGIYLSKVFVETKRRPYSIVRKVYATRIKKDEP